MEKENKLYILWTNGEPITSDKMVLTYAVNCKIAKWWDEVCLLIVGAPNILIRDSIDIKNRIKECIANGVEVISCKKCSDELGTSEELSKLGINVQYIGKLITDILKEKEHLLTI